MKAKIPFQGSFIEAEGEADEIYMLIRRFAETRRSIIVKPKIAESQKEASTTPTMPAKEEVADFIMSKGEDFRHTFKEIELHFLGKTYNANIPTEKSQYDQIYIRVVKARVILQKAHGGVWKNRRTPTNEREYWLEKGDEQQATQKDY